MSQPIDLSDELVHEAQASAGPAHRSVAGQIEFWAQLGRAIAPLLERNLALDANQAGAARPLSECLAAVDSEEGRRRVRAYLKSRPYPHFEPVAGAAGLLVRIDEDGTRTLGRFAGGEFQATEQ